MEATNVNDAYTEVLWNLQISGERQASRNGPVVSIPYPVMIRYHRPWERVLFSPVRDANPFFHLMEVVWMFAGENKVEWLAQFNKRMREYAEPLTGRVHGAYGYRWIRHFDIDQIDLIIDRLNHNWNDRQLVLQMWDAPADLGFQHLRDRPCNTHCYFRVVGDKLNMTICNRSNDAIWGATGANAVHFSVLHEVIARCSALEQGEMVQFTNNLHIYTEMPRFDEIWNDRVNHDAYKRGVETMPVLQPLETWSDLRRDCRDFMDGEMAARTKWIKSVIYPAWKAWALHKAGETAAAIHVAQGIQAEDWALACANWLRRRVKA